MDYGDNDAASPEEAGWDEHEELSTLDLDVLYIESFAPSNVNGVKE